jgi:dienelactone hydrolase
MSLRIIFVGLFAAVLATQAQSISGTAPLTESGDLAARMVSGIDQYLERELANLPARRASASTYKGDTEGDQGWQRWAEARRKRLAELLGMTDQRDETILRDSTPLQTEPAAAGKESGTGGGFRTRPVSWTVFRGVTGEGLLLIPSGSVKANVVVIPDADWTPEQMAGVSADLPAEWQLGRRLAAMGCRVLIPTIIDRGTRFGGNPTVHPVEHSQRETLWRASYEMGRSLVGYEIEKVLGAADWLSTPQPGRAKIPLAIAGHGEGGLMALYAAAIDPRFEAAYVSGYFGPHDRLGDETLDRNVWNLSTEFGTAEIAVLLGKRPLWLEAGEYPEFIATDAKGGSPGTLRRPSASEVEREYSRLKSLNPKSRAVLIPSGAGHVGAELEAFAKAIGANADNNGDTAKNVIHSSLPDPTTRMRRQYLELLEDTQVLMRESEYTRRSFWKKADTSSLGAFTNSTRAYRDYFREHVVGVIPRPSIPPTPRTRFLGETNGYRRYEVMLDVHPNVFAYGILCIPTSIQAGERRPVVVCQHGLEGRPVDVADPTIDSQFYHQYACKLAERGFVTFAPQNPYIGNTKFRQVLHKAQPLGLTLWSFIVRQHEVITDWLASQDYVDPNRIGFYGLSYGGKTAMRVPLLVDRYCLSICSADYNEWILKNTSARSPYSYLWTSEYDMPEWNLANTFNYAEMSWLILPRPFMVERGHDDGVAPDEWVAFEYAKTRRQFVKLGLGEKTEIEFFDGPHSIHGVGTFEFLSRHLQWPPPPAQPGKPR